MTMMYDDWVCEHCKKNVQHQHRCTPVEESREYTCEYCGREGVNHRHMCKGKLEHLSVMCLNCGAVATDPLHVCSPVEIDDETLEHWKQVTIEGEGEDPQTCNVCGQPVTPPGHYCDRKLPYDCQYCGEHVEDNYHVCREMTGKFKFICANCGRLGVEASDVCAPQELPE